MSEPGEEFEPLDNPRADAPVEGTGAAEVDAVVESLNELDAIPVADHVRVFEEAHESLRRTLAGAGQNDPAAGRS